MLVNRRVEANRKKDIFPIYDSGRLFWSALMTGMHIIPLTLVSLSSSLTSSSMSRACWWLALAALAFDFYLLVEVLKDGSNRISDAEKKLKDGWVWKNNTWELKS